MATINGHFDLAPMLLARGADVTAASDAGATPLYGVLNMQWAPKARHPQPAHYMQQQVDYLELAEALLEGRRRRERAARPRRSGTPPTTATCSASIAPAPPPFWRAAYTLDIPAMQLLLKYGADPNIRTAKVPERYEEGGPIPSAARSVGPAADSVARPGGGADPRRLRRRLRPRLRRQRPSPRARRLGAGGEVPGRRARRRRQRPRQRRLHAAAPRGRARRQRR